MANSPSPSSYVPEERFLLEILAALVHHRSVRYFPTAEENFDWDKFYQLTRRQDLSGTAGYVLEKQAALIPENVRARLLRDRQTLLFLEARRQTEIQPIFRLLDEAQIPYLPLKGYIIRQWYPSPELRSMSDLDILVPPEKLEETSRLFQENGFVLEHKSSHHYSFKRFQVIVEVHHTFFQAFRYQSSGQLFQGEISPFYDDASFWKRSLPTAAGSLRQADRLDFFLMFFLHLTRHFLSRGIGIRYILDYQIIKNALPFTLNDPDIAERLQELSLTTFAAQIDRLGEVWFSDAPSDAALDRLGRFLFSYTVHGEKTDLPKMGLAQALADSHQVSGDVRRRFLSHLFFPPFQKIARFYPSLNRFSYLYPAYALYWMSKRLFHFSNWPLYAKQILWIFRVQKEDLDEQSQLYRDLGFKTSPSQRSDY